MSKHLWILNYCAIYVWDTFLFDIIIIILFIGVESPIENRWLVHLNRNREILEIEEKKEKKLEKRWIRERRKNRVGKDDGVGTDRSISFSSNIRERSTWSLPRNNLKYANVLGVCVHGYWVGCVGATYE